MTLNHHRRLLPYIPTFGPPALQRKIVELVPHKGLQLIKTFIDGLHDESVKIYRAKLEALEDGDEAVAKQVGEGKDLMSILSELSRIVTYV